MNVIVFGATGMVGSRIVTEALRRGHAVTAVVRNPAGRNAVPADARLRVADARRPESLDGLIDGHDVAVSALRPPPGREASLAALTEAVVDAAATAGVRVVVVGGAAHLRLPGGSGETVLSAPGFLPDTVIPIAKACAAQHAMLLRRPEGDWSHISPPAMMEPGRRTGLYRRGDAVLLVDEDGRSAISAEDFAVAVMDEAERPRRLRQPFTVAAA